MERSVSRTLVILLIVIVTAAYSNRSRKKAIVNSNAMGNTFVEAVSRSQFLNYRF